ncbi:MAG: NADH-quinone oxidoreductase subunit NuoE [Candidatus Rokuibacteriota bacterium]
MKAAGTVAFSAKQLGEVRRLQGLYPEPRAALLPVLRMAQETFGHISPEAEAYVAELFDLSPAHVHEVVTFYTLFFQRPVGRHVLSVCHNLTCTLVGAEDILAYLQERLGIEPGETTPDGRVTLFRVECLCACEMAPMMQVDDDYMGPLTRARIDQVLEGLGA